MVASDGVAVPISAEPIAFKLLSDEPNFMDTNVDLMPLMQFEDNDNHETTISTYRSKRDRNNLASQKSRAIRKRKFDQLKEELVDLESHNTQLKSEMARLERMTAEWKRQLITMMSH
jgi:hypothetical protein